MIPVLPGRPILWLPCLHWFGIYGCRDCLGCYFCEHEPNVLALTWRCRDGRTKRAAPEQRVPLVSYDRQGRAFEVPEDYFDDLAPPAGEEAGR